MKYKLAVRWANGDIEGYLGEGSDEDDARCQALKSVFNDSAANGVGFTVIPPPDVPLLPREWQEVLNKHWDTVSKMLDDPWGWP